VRLAEFPAEPGPGRPPPHRSGPGFRPAAPRDPRESPAHHSGQWWAEVRPMESVGPGAGAATPAAAELRFPCQPADAAAIRPRGHCRAAQAVDTIAVSTGRWKLGPSRGSTARNGWQATCAGTKPEADGPTGARRLAPWQTPSTSRPATRVRGSLHWPGARQAGTSCRREPNVGAGSLTRRGQWSTVYQRATGGPLAVPAVPEGPGPRCGTLTEEGGRCAWRLAASHAPHAGARRMALPRSEQARPLGDRSRHSPDLAHSRTLKGEPQPC